jgi:hypothetical protein
MITAGCSFWMGQRNVLWRIKKINTMLQRGRKLTTHEGESLWYSNVFNLEELLGEFNQLMKPNKTLNNPEKN